MSKTAKNLGLVFASLALAFLLGLLTANQFATIYSQVTGATLGGSILDFSGIIGLIFSVYFFALLFLGVFKGTLFKVVAVVLTLLIISFFVAAADFTHIYFPLLLGAISYGIGFVLSKLFNSK